NYNASYTSTSDYHNNGLVVKLNTQGSQLWQHDYRGVTRIGQQLEDNVLHDCEVLSDGSIIACGVAQDNNDTFPQQAWLLRINADGCLDDGFCGYTGLDEVKKEPREQTILKVYPNPAKNSVTIQYVDVQEKSNLVITNIFGTQVDMLPLTEGNGKLILNIGSYVSGMYLISVESLGRIAAKYKLVVQK
ncbi:MAG TPA: T9SS type A sorting domain-containing protein, partial [Chitinophagales bacterium]|nr:T9SS type A sorting domain-containing protein [Chitinophagales bacterium]